MGRIVFRFYPYINSSCQGMTDGDEGLPTALLERLVIQVTQRNLRLCSKVTGSDGYGTLRLDAELATILA
jgi:hypothetical protein